MIYELSPSEFHRARPLFRFCKQYVPVFAVLDAVFPGRVYVDSIDAPTAAIVLALTRWAYVDGDMGNATVIRALPQFIRDVITPVFQELDMNWFELYAPPNERWITALNGTLAALSAEKHWESTYILDVQRYQQHRRGHVVPLGMELRMNHLPLVPQASPGLPVIPAEFVEQTSVGFELVRGDHVISVCRSNGLQAGNEFMVDVRTYPREDRRRGYARIVATALIDHALERGFSPLWETTEDNIASRRLAESLGYIEAESYPVYAIPLDVGNQ